MRPWHGFYEDYSSFELIRGHEGDAWRSSPREIDPERLGRFGGGDPDGLTNSNVQYARNVADFEAESDFFTPRVFSTAADWVEANREWDRWFPTVDSFDIHQPFHVPQPYRSTDTDIDPEDPELPLWHDSGWLEDEYWTERKLEFVRAQYAGKVTMLDRWLGRLFDRLDEHGLWNDTLVVVTSDHGIGLGDHGYVRKNTPPVHDELAHLPLFVWDPESDRMGERISTLASAVDVHATLIDALDLEGDSVHGRSLLPLLRRGEETGREFALYGWHYGSVNITDGRYTYLRPTDPDGPLYEETAIAPDPDAVPGEPALASRLPYTDYPVWKIPREPSVQNADPLCYDTREDPDQKRDLVGEEPGPAGRLREAPVETLGAMDAPEWQYDRLGLDDER